MGGGLSKKEQPGVEAVDACRAEWKRASDADPSPENVEAMDRADRQLDAKLLEVYGGYGS